MTSRHSAKRTMNMHIQKNIISDKKLYPKIAPCLCEYGKLQLKKEKLERKAVTVGQINKVMAGALYHE